jgi:hypothetical protein
MSATTKTKKWLVDTDEVDAAIDQAMERILNRDGRRIYEAASGDLLTMYANTIAHMDGGPDRLLGMLRQLEAMYRPAPALSCAKRCKVKHSGAGDASSRRSV